MSPVPRDSLPKDQYQHYIPRFILRYFQDAQIRPRNRKERQKNFNRARRTGVDKDSILMYDITDQTFESRPIAKLYGVVNMYRDVRSKENVDHLEQGLSRLENDAARAIRTIHTSVELGQQEITMTRKELETIRKFTYLMHYRRLSLINSYFDENETQSLGDWIRVFRQKHNLHNKNDLWLFGLKYLLDTPHPQLVAATLAIQDKYGGAEGVSLMLRTRVDPDIDYFAFDYGSMASDYFLGIWEAAEGEEFVIGSNSFGLWEGVVGDLEGLHRLFVVSPKIALILRQGIMTAEILQRIEAGGEPIRSLLNDIPMNRATSTYASFKFTSWTTRGEHEAAARALWKYRLTPEAQEDIFTFKLARLTRKQTYDLNHTLLLNIPNNGSVSFASPSAMIKTLKYHLNSTDTGTQESKYLFRSLLGDLSAGPTHPDASGSGIDIILQAVANGIIEFRSAYDRAYKVYHAATDDIAKYNQASSDIHQMTARAILKMKNILPPLPTANQYHYFPYRDIAKELPQEESELFFALIGYQVDVLEIGPASNDVVDRIKYEAAIIGFTHWLAESRPMELIERLFFWAKVVV